MKWLKLNKKIDLRRDSFLLAAIVALLSAVLIFQQPMEASASIDPGLDSGNATVDRTSVPGETILTYSTVGDTTFAAPAGVTDVRVLVVGGGGGGGAGETTPPGDGAGGGGAGEFVHQTSFTVTPGASVPVTVGDGGAGSSTTQAGGAETPASNGANGDDSQFSSLTSRGGGGGGGNDLPGLDGGSGGGAGGHCSNSGSDTNGGASTAVAPGVGNAGGTSPSGSCNPRSGAGGGGAGAAGTNGSSSNAGAGAIGLQNDITGTNTFYAAGAGGGGGDSSDPGASGGSSIGGNGGNASGGNGTNGATNTGSGGGGGGSTDSSSNGGVGGDGGSGVVVVRFTTQETPDPGNTPGVFTWQKADDGSATGALWPDSSNNFRDAVQNTATSQPTFVDNGMNFNPAFQFDGADDFMAITGQNYNASSAGEDIFVAVLPSSASGYRNVLGFGTNSNTNNVMELRYTNSRLQYGAGPSWSTVTNPDVSAENPQIANAHRFSDTSTPAKLLMNGTEVASGDIGAYSTLQQLNIGARRHNASNNQFFDGMIAEVIYYDKELSGDERQRVATYLGLKYGVTLGHDYVDSAGTVVWDQASGSYNSDIAGIGRDDDATLNQKQSKSVNNGSLVTVGHDNIAATNQSNTNDFANDKAYMVWGNDGGGIDQTVDVSGTSYKRMGRVWKTNVTSGAAGTIQVQIPTNVITRSEAIMLVSDSPTFDGSSQVETMTVNGANYETTTSLADGTRYFTFASPAGSDIELVSKTATDISSTPITNYTPGQPLEYHLTVRNNGPDDAGTVTVNDTLPADMVPTGASGGGWSCPISGQTVTCTRSSLASGATAPEIIIEATISSATTGQKVNTASASVANDPDTSNNDASRTLDAAPKADLSLTKADTTGTPVAGQPLTYEFNVTNSGPSDSPSFSVTDTLDANLTYQSSTPDICSASGQDVTCTGSTLASGDSTTFTMTVMVDGGYGGGDISNTAEVNPPTGVTDPNTANNSATNDTSVTVSTDLTISKTHTGNFIAGENNDFTINVTNNGPSDAPSSSITVTDTLDEDFAFVSATGTGWACNHTNGTVTCTYNAILTSTSTTPDITLTVLVDPIVKGTTTNTATVSGTTPDPDTTNNSATDNITITAEADMAITKDHVGTEFTAGEQEQYTFSVVNNGPSADTPTYTITDTLPTGLTFVSTEPGSATSCSATGQVVKCDGGGIGAGDPAQVTTINVAVDVSATGSFNNTATVEPDPSVTDPTPANNSDDDTVNVTPNADLSITKSPPSALTAGDTADYTITVTNNGPTDVPSFTIADTLDPNLTYQSATGATCSAVNQDVTCDGGSIASGNNAVITLTVDVASSAVNGLNIDNTASVAGPTSMNDPDTGNNSATASQTVSLEADLSIAKSHTGDFKPANNGTFTIEVTNNGPSDMDVYTVTDVLPNDFTYVSATGDASCQAANQTVTCDGGMLTASETDTIEVTVSIAENANVGSGIDNTATVSSANDPTPDNNTSTDTVTIDPATANLTATKTAQSTLTAGQPVTYRFEVTNDGGPDNAGVVTISDTLPSYLTYQSFESVSGGTWDCNPSNDGVDCTLPVLNVGDTAAVDVTVLVDQDAPTPAENNATVTFNGTDPSPVTLGTSNDVSYEADLELQLTHDSETYQSGDTVTYTYTIINHGPSRAKDVVLTDNLPEGLTFENIVATTPSTTQDSLLAQALDTVLGTTPASAAPNTPFDCNNNGQDITCTTDTLLVGTYTITMTAQIGDNFTGSLTTNAQITSATPDPNMDNNTATSTIANVTPAPGGIAGVVDGLADTGQNLLVWIVGALALVGGGVVWWRRRAAPRG